MMILTFYLTLTCLVLVLSQHLRSIDHLRDRDPLEAEPAFTYYDGFYTDYSSYFSSLMPTDNPLDGVSLHLKESRFDEPRLITQQSIRTHSIPMSSLLLEDISFFFSDDEFLRRQALRKLQKRPQGSFTFILLAMAQLLTNQNKQEQIDSLKDELSFTNSTSGRIFLRHCNSCIIPANKCNPNHYVCTLRDTQEYNPVCGCDGVTYDNACVARYNYCNSNWTVGACAE